MGFISLGRTFKTKSGKATKLILSTKDIELLTANMKTHEKYGDQVQLLISGTPDSKYGHSISILTDEEGNKSIVDDTFDIE